MNVTRRDELEKLIQQAEWSLSTERSKGDHSRVTAKINGLIAKADEIEAEIAQVRQDFKDAPANIKKAEEHLDKLRQRLAKHDNRHDIARLEKLVKEIANHG